MMVRGIRGATTVEVNTREAITEAAAELLEAVVKANHVERDYVASIIFTTTPDLNAEFPAVAARNAGWTDVALICGHEMSVPGGLPRCLPIPVPPPLARAAAPVSLPCAGSRCTPSRPPKRPPASGPGVR